jgi:hypothetical protein
MWYVLKNKGTKHPLTHVGGQSQACGGEAPAANGGAEKKIESRRRMPNTLTLNFLIYVGLTDPPYPLGNLPTTVRREMVPQV